MNSDPASPYGKIRQVIYVKSQPLFPISWLQKQDYCEYQIYLENVRGIKVKPTKAMSKGAEEHEQLYEKFAKEAVPATVEEMFTESKTAKILSREFRVVDLAHGVYGYIDEVWLTPDRFIVIDDKPGIKLYDSNIHQIYGYCLAFKALNHIDNRQIFAALRERGTDNIFWQAPFDKNAEEEIILVINRVHTLISGKEQFAPTHNRNKCNACRFSQICEKIARGDDKT